MTRLSERQIELIDMTGFISRVRPVGAVKIMGWLSRLGAWPLVRAMSHVVWVERCYDATGEWERVGTLYETYGPIRPR